MSKKVLVDVRKVTLLVIHSVQDFERICYMCLEDEKLKQACYIYIGICSHLEFYVLAVRYW